MEKVKLFFKLAAISVRSQMQYKASFFMLALSHFISTFADIFGIWVLFDRFKMVEGWTLEEVALIYGVMHMGFALAESFARGFDTFSHIVRNGDFDRVLLRPMGSLFQIAARDIQIMRIGRFLQGLVILIYGFLSLKLSFFSWNTPLLLFAVIGSASLFYGLFIIQATLSFWTVETLEIVNITTYGGLETGQYPMSIYNRPFRLFFTFIIPLACVAYYPTASMLHHDGFNVFGMLGPLAGLFFLFLASKLWKIGVNHYHSTGS